MKNQIFTSKEFGEIRTHVDEKGEPWFCLADICRVLELQTGNTKQRLDKIFAGCWNCKPAILNNGWIRGVFIR